MEPLDRNPLNWLRLAPILRLFSSRDTWPGSLQMARTLRYATLLTSLDFSRRVIICQNNCYWFCNGINRLKYNFDSNVLNKYSAHAFFCTSCNFTHLLPIFHNIRSTCRCSDARCISPNLLRQLRIFQLPRSTDKTNMKSAHKKKRTCSSAGLVSPGLSRRMHACKKNGKINWPNRVRKTCFEYFIRRENVVFAHAITRASSLFKV